MTLHWFRFCLIFLCLPGISGLFAEDGESPVHFESVPGMLSCRTLDSCSSGTFRVENRGSRKAEVWMSLRVESWNRETLSVERSFLLPPHTVRKVTLFYPLPRSYGNQKLSIAVDGKRVESPSLIFPSAVWGKIALTSPALPLEDYRKLGLLGGNPHPVVPTVSLAQWGTELRDYSACGMIFLSSRDRLSAGVGNAIRNWMMLGGILVRYVAPSDPWPEGVPEPENSCLVQSCGWGKEIICRPIPAEKALDAARAIRALEKKTIPPPLIRRIYEIKIMAFYGLGMEVFQCVRCGSRENLTGFQPSEGGIVCASCGKSLYPVSPSTLYTLQFILCSPVEKLYTFRVSQEVQKELEMIIKAFLRIHFQHEFKSQVFLPEP